MSKCKYFIVKKGYTAPSTCLEIPHKSNSTFQSIEPQFSGYFDIYFCKKFNKECICKGFGGECDYSEAIRNSFTARKNNKRFK